MVNENTAKYNNNGESNVWGVPLKPSEQIQLTFVTCVPEIFVFLSVCLDFLFLYTFGGELHASASSRDLFE